jgi:hypothetical protein
LYFVAVDVIKTRYMADVAGTYRSVPHCVVDLFKREGISGFFKV